MVSLLGGPVDFVEKMDSHLSPAPIVRDVLLRLSGSGQAPSIRAAWDGRRCAGRWPADADGYDRSRGRLRPARRTRRQD